MRHSRGAEVTEQLQHASTRNARSSSACTFHACAVVTSAKCTSAASIVRHLLYIILLHSFFTNWRRAPLRSDTHTKPSCPNAEEVDSSPRSEEGRCVEVFAVVSCRAPHHGIYRAWYISGTLLVARSLVSRWTLLALWPPTSLLH